MKARPHHRQQASNAGFGASSSAVVTDPLLRSSATTEWVAGTNAVSTAAEIDDSRDFVSNSEVFIIATSYKIGGS
jgi:hypothetical protein